MARRVTADARLASKPDARCVFAGFKDPKAGFKDPEVGFKDPETGPETPRPELLVGLSKDLME